MTTEERYRNALLNIIDSKGTAVDVYAIAQAALNPPPEYEEVEVVRWACSQCLNVLIRKDGNCHVCLANPPSIRLTGTCRREKKPKVKRREWLGIIQGIHSQDVSMFPKTADVFAEWSE